MTENVLKRWKQWLFLRFWVTNEMLLFCMNVQYLNSATSRSIRIQHLWEQTGPSNSSRSIIAQLDWQILLWRLLSATYWCCSRFDHPSCQDLLWYILHLQFIRSIADLAAEAEMRREVLRCLRLAAIVQWQLWKDIPVFNLTEWQDGIKACGDGRPKPMRLRLEGKWRDAVETDGYKERSLLFITQRTRWLSSAILKHSQNSLWL